MLQGYQDSVLLLSVLLYSQKKYEDVLAALSYAVKYNINDADIWFYAGLAAYQLKKFQDSARYLARSVQLDAQNYQAWTFLEISARQLGNATLAGEAATHMKQLQQQQKDVDRLPHLRNRLSGLCLQMF